MEGALKNRALEATVAVMLLIAALPGIDWAIAGSNPLVKSPDDADDKIANPRVLFVNSYHSGYEWSDGIIAGVSQGFNRKKETNGPLKSYQKIVDLKFVEMDTKRNASEEFKIQAGLDVKATIEHWQPHIVITADDNAFKYVTVLHYANAELPFVFCGVNWDVSHYKNAPFKNTTGMIEVAHFEPLIGYLSKFAKGNRLGFLAGDRYSDRAEAEYARKFLSIHFAKEYYVKNFEEWRQAFLNLQTEVDMFIWTAIGGINDWHEEDAQKTIYESSRIPFGTVNEWMMPYELLGVVKDPHEQGLHAAQTALKILNGQKPSDIPIVKNTKAKIFLNMRLAKKMGVKFDLTLLENAHLISAEKVGN